MELQELMSRVKGVFVSDDFRTEVMDALDLLRVTRRAAEAIKLDLNKALDVVAELQSETSQENRKLKVSIYQGLILSLGAHAQEARQNGKSLIDGSNCEIELSRAGGGWARKIDHHDLTTGPGGLAMPSEAALVTDGDIDESQRLIAAAMKKTDRALSAINGDLQALESQLQSIGGVREQEELPKEQDSFSEIASTVVIALIIAVLIRSFLFQPFNIPSGSMKSTLLVGDYLFVSKFSYGYSHKSIPFGLKFFRGRIFESAPERGDVVVFKLPRDGKTDYIKRVIGLPGDTVQMRRGVLYINGVAVPKAPLDEFTDIDPRRNETRILQRHTEVLPNGVAHTTLDDRPYGLFDTTDVFRVPKGHYFMMGDNRDNSQDSRAPGGGVGYVPSENLVGKAQILFFSVDGSARLWEIWKWPFAIRYERMFDRIR